MEDFKLSSARNVCIIPARGGSKRLPSKNRLPFLGVPLIQRAVKIARSARSVDIVCVSSDDATILQLARDAGADVVSARPSYLASDLSKSSDVLLYTLDELTTAGFSGLENIVMLQATAPLALGTDIDLAFDQLKQPGVRSVVSVCATDHPPIWSQPLTADGFMDSFYQANISHVRSQDLPPCHRLNGAVYLAPIPIFIQTGSFLLPQGTKALIMPSERSVDIDTKLDWDVAEFFARRMEIYGIY